MKTIKIDIEQQVIIDLISDDLLNLRLIGGLKNLGIEASEYYQEISTGVFKLIGFKEEERTDELYEFYDQEAMAIREIAGRPSGAELSELALRIYVELLVRKRGEAG
jgi:hypothetical protein